MPSVVEETIEQKLKRHEDALAACMAEITKLRAENARLRSSEADAHSTLRMIYGDDSQPANVRVRAATAALNVETPALQRVPPAIDATCEEIEPIHEVVSRQRARCDALQREARDIAVDRFGVVRILPKPGSNGGNGSDDSDQS